MTDIDTESPEYKAYVEAYIKRRAAKLAAFPKTEFSPPETFVVIDQIRCRAPINMDGSYTHIRIDWPDGHEILVHRKDAALLRDWLINVLDPELDP